MKRFLGRSSMNSLMRLALVAFFLLGGASVLWASLLPIPDLRSFEERKVEQSTKIYDRTGEVLLFDVHENIQRTVIPLSEMSRHIKNATVAIEDAEFYQHRGIKPRAVLRAILANIGSFELSQGGSTITQQVVKNSLLTSEKKISRKIKEWVLAIKLERVLSKEEILELYLNETPYGGSMYGVEEASEAFFGKPASELSLAEAAYLAALPQAPTYYSPYGNHRDNLEDRKNLVLQKMLENGFISQTEHDEAMRERVVFKPPRDKGIKAPHFVFFIREYLEKTFGERAIEEAGLKVVTTLDYSLQEKAEEIVRRFALENKEKFNAENAGLVAIDPRSGHILVMVGSRNYSDPEIDGNFNVVLARRQPGSAFKPFVYAAAFQKGYTTEATIFDVPTQFSTLCNPDNLENKESCYAPTNYDNAFRGPVTFREALAQSINVPSVKVLYLAGLSESLRLAKDLGVSTLTDVNRYGLTLVLGGGEVTLLDMTSAYGVFATEGIRNPATGILRIEDREGNILQSFEPRPVRVVSEEITRMVSDILSDNVARAPAFGENSYLYFPGRDVAAKTGTTNDYRDAWIIGYTPSLAVGAWAGNNDNSPMEKRVAGFIVAPLWHAFMEEVLPTLPEESFIPPLPHDERELKPVLRGIWQGGVSYFIDTVSGKRATEFTPRELTRELVKEDIHSILYWVNKDDPRGPPPEKPESDPQFLYWERGVERWKTANHIVEKDVVVPTEFDDVHGPQFAPRVSFVSPRTEQLFGGDARIVAAVSAQGPSPLSRVDYFVNGVLVGSARTPPFSISFAPSELPTITEKNTLTAVAYDPVLNKTEISTIFRVLP